MPVRVLAVDDLFYAPDGHCKNCQKPLTGRRQSWCSEECSRAMTQYFWNFVSKEFLEANKECVRCHAKEKLEVAHMLSVEIIASHRNIMRKHEFIERKKYVIWDALGKDEKEHCPPWSKVEELWSWSAEIEAEWKLQIQTNRAYMEAILDKKNLRTFCQACHDWSHARAKLQADLRKFARWKAEGLKVSTTKVRMTEYRLEILDRENTPELCRERGYAKYWSDKDTHWTAWRKDFKREKSVEDTQPLTSFLQV